tara:strand:+ start:1738 stop:2556 length:819 start_codon:yes stop_codon:yes gene_type:complete
MFRAISLGAGVQSTVMSLMAARGEIKPMPDCAIFADTQWEPKGVYDHLDWLETQLPFPVYRVTEGDIRRDTLHASQNGKDEKGRFATVPFFTLEGDNKGMGRRQCTYEYKLKPIRKKIRELVGLKKGQRVARGWIVAHTWLGISTDEAGRMKPSRDAWQFNVYPLILNNISRQDCIAWFAKHYPGRTLAKSACIGCPFHNNVQWRDMKINDPTSFADAIEFDEGIRYPENNEDIRQFLHAERKPLAEVDLQNLEDKGQLNLFMNECEGMCGV